MPAMKRFLVLLAVLALHLAAVAAEAPKLVEHDGHFALMVDGKPLQWSFAGYREASAPITDAMLLTPPSTVRAFGAGYRPVLHASARV